MHLGVGQGHIEMPPGDSFPLESNLEYMNGVSFHKGCYVGQELTARTHHIGETRKRLVPVAIEAGAVPLPGTPLKTKEGKSAGRFRDAMKEAKVGIAQVRLNFLEGDAPVELQAQDDAGNTTVLRAHKPSWWPQDTRDPPAEPATSLDN
eukprot:Colp12_sorted_trinity150504_noHs@17276